MGSVIRLHFIAENDRCSLSDNQSQAGGSNLTSPSRGGSVRGKKKKYVLVSNLENLEGNGQICLFRSEFRIALLETMYLFIFSFKLLTCLLRNSISEQNN